jgi:hypothetical protein
MPLLRRFGHIFIAIFRREEYRHRFPNNTKFSIEEERKIRVRHQVSIELQSDKYADLSIRSRDILMTCSEDLKGKT